MAVVSLTQIFGRSGLGKAAAHNLFLGIRLTPDRTKQEQTAWVRSLDRHSALIVSPKVLSKGDLVRIDLGSLPDYPADAAPLVDAEVVRVWVRRGSPDTFEVRLRFARMAPNLRTRLSQYVQRLAEHSRMQHA
jgi:hypothetical protein